MGPQSPLPPRLGESRKLFSHARIRLSLCIRVFSTISRTKVIPSYAEADLKPNNKTVVLQPQQTKLGLSRGTAAASRSGGFSGRTALER